jgi:phosphomannomutase
MKTVFLFDLDGTLCASRKKVTKKIIKLLSKANKSIEIGILTGSDMDFLREQCEELFLAMPHDCRVYALACNGTKAYNVIKSDGELSYDVIKEEDLRAHLGEEAFRVLMTELIYAQAEIMQDADDIPLTGTFITYRGSTINWCPIGRMATDADRNKFKKIDAERGLRVIRASELQEILDENGIKLTAVIAGDTSFDIYPENWDKTYAMQFFEEYDVYYWGDRMTPEGNDYTMRKLLGDMAFPVSGPKDTYDSVKKKMKDLDI